MGKRLTSNQRRQFSTRNKLRSVNISANAVREIRPRLSVHRTGKQIYAQIIDDNKGQTLCAASSLSKELDGQVKSGANKIAARAVGKLIAQKAKEKSIEKVVFDRGCYLYHGRIKELAEGAREGGLKF